jgi:hypothetical protein
MDLFGVSEEHERNVTRQFPTVKAVTSDNGNIGQQQKRVSLRKGLISTVKMRITFLKYTVLEFENNGID